MNQPKQQPSARQNGPPLPTGPLPTHLLPSRPKPVPSNVLLPATPDQRHLFTFSPNGHLQFFDVLNSGVSVDVDKSQPSLRKPKDVSLTDMLESTAIGDSFKKHLSDAAKKTVAAGNAPGVPTPGLSTTGKNRPDLAGSVARPRRTRSVTVGSFEDYLKTTSGVSDACLVNQKVDWMKNGNYSGQKVLNVQLSRNYIQSYKDSRSSSQEDVAPPAHNTSLDKDLEAEAVPGTLQPRAQATPVSPRKPPCTPAKNASGRPNVHPHPSHSLHSAQTPTPGLPNASKATSHHIPAALETFYQRKMASSARKVSRSRPKVFDYCQRLPDTRAAPSLGALFLSKLSQGDTASLAPPPAPEFARYFSQK